MKLLKTYLKKEYPIYLLERKRLAKAIGAKVNEPAQDFTIRELIESLSLKLSANSIVYRYYWSYANDLLLPFLHEGVITRQKEDKGYRYFTLTTE